MCLHINNYQQRVGRAGRGSSEVSIALTWVDNTAFATSFFNMPESLVTSPKIAPKIYIDNHVIKTRHLNAILIQRFFKDEQLHPYNPETLTFRPEGHQQSSGLLESLGTYDEFISDDIPTFGYDDFSNWCNELLAGIQTFADGGAMTDDVQNHLNSICESMNGNLTNPMSRETIRIGIGQLLAQLNPEGDGDE